MSFIARPHAILRTALVVGGLAAAASSAVFSYKAFLRRSDPVSAHRKFPTDGIAVVAVANAATQNDPFKSPPKEMAENAAASLVQRPLNEGALRILGAYHEAAGMPAQASAAMLLADKVSRRDPINQMWLIEYAIGKNDVPSAIAHYNAALSVEPKLGSLLYPILSKALAFPEVRSALVPYVTAGAKWMPAFLAAASENAQIADLKPFALSVSSRLGGPTYQYAMMKIAHRMAVSGDLAAARQMISQVAPGNTTRLDDLGTGADAQDTRLGQLAWWFAQTDQINTTVNDDGSMVAIVSPSANGAIATRDIIVAPEASYRISYKVAYVDDGPKATTSFDVYCIGTKGIVQLNKTTLPANGRSFDLEVPIQIPAECYVARVSFSAIGPDSQFPSSISLSRLKLNRLP